MLYLPRNLHFEVYQVLCLPRNLHFEVHQILPLQRNLHSKVNQALHLPRNLHSEVHQVLRLRRNLYIEVHQVLRLPRNLHFEGPQVLRLPQNLQTSHFFKNHDSLHLLGNLNSWTTPAMFKVLYLRRKVHFEIKQFRSLAPVTKSRLWRTKTRGSLCICHEKMTTMYQNAHGAATRAQSLEAAAAGRRPPDSASLGN